MQCCYTYILWLRGIVVALSLLVALPHTQTNRPFPSSPGPLYHDEVTCKCPAFVMEIFFTLPRIKLIFTRNAELYGSKFYHTQKHPSILITHLSRLFHCSSRVKERDILHIYTPTSVSSSFKERGMLHIHSACFVS